MQIANLHNLRLHTIVEPCRDHATIVEPSRDRTTIVCNIEIAKDSENAQRNLENAQILRLRGTCIYTMQDAWSVGSVVLFNYVVTHTSNPQWLYY